MTLDTLKVGHSGIIKAVGGHESLRRRLLDMGLTPGTEIRVCKMAPLGDPIEIYLRGYFLTIRKADARQLDITEVFET